MAIAEIWFSNMFCVSQIASLSIIFHLVKWWSFTTVLWMCYKVFYNLSFLTLFMVFHREKPYWFCMVLNVWFFTAKFFILQWKIWLFPFEMSEMLFSRIVVWHLKIMVRLIWKIFIFSFFSVQNNIIVDAIFKKRKKVSPKGTIYSSFTFDKKHLAAKIRKNLRVEALKNKHIAHQGKDHFFLQRKILYMKLTL